ncbi:MAG: hypothetical protein JSV33_00550 [bacterium]|nr:MAG: hypothetical protein JSV33_00550 [bacterium]
MERDFLLSCIGGECTINRTCATYSTMRIRRIIIPFLLSITSICVLFVVLELGMRIFKPQKYFAISVNQWDRHVGTKQIPGIKGFIICPEYEIDLTINSKGLRDKEYPYRKPPGTRRILCLGDSYTCGYGVQAEETFVKVLEVHLNEQESRSNRWEVLNAGIGSTGTANQLALFETECYKYEPDLVVLLFCQTNDYYDNLTCGLYSLKDGILIKHDAPRTAPRKIQKIVYRIPGYTTFFARSHLLNYLKYRLSVTHRNRLTESCTQNVSTNNIAERYNTLTKHLISALGRACNEKNSRLIAMFIPVHPSMRGLPKTTELVEHCSAQGISCLDLEPHLREADEKNIQTSHLLDGHWNATGHRLVAHALYDFLVEQSLLGEVIIQE